MRAADVSSLRMLRRARDRIDRDYAGQLGTTAGRVHDMSPPQGGDRRQGHAVTAGLIPDQFGTKDLPEPD